MNEDFASAALRHWEDSALLLEKGRFDNAAYHAGYAVECALKLLARPTRLRPRDLGHDLATLSGSAVVLGCLMSPGVRRYNLPPSPHFEDLIWNWNPEMRYWPTGHINASEAERWLNVASDVIHAIVIEWILDGGECACEAFRRSPK